MWNAGARNIASGILSMTGYVNALVSRIIAMILETRVQLLHLEEYCAKNNHYPDFEMYV